MERDEWGEEWEAFGCILFLRRKKVCSRFSNMLTLGGGFLGVSLKSFFVFFGMTEMPHN